MDLTMVTYCGLYCGLCSNIARTPKQAAALLDTMVKDGWEWWGTDEQKAFVAELRKLTKIPEGFTGCRGGTCGDPGCVIRKCAAEKRVEICTHCEEYPCSRFDGLAKRYPTLLADGKRQKEIGLEKWIAEQEDRAKTGFCYADIRCP